MKSPQLSKVDLEGLIAILTDLWDKGVDYIDITVDGEDNRLGIYFSEDYLSEEAKEEVKNMKSKEIKPTNISDLNLNDLI